MSFECSGAMPGTPRSIRHTSHPCAAEYRSTSSTLRGWWNCSSQTRRTTPATTPSSILSEGAEWEGFTVQEYGDPDAFGHRKKMSVGEAFSEEIKRLAKEETIVSDLTYDLRGGDPDFIDKLVANTFGAMAFDAVLAGKSGLMAAVQNGCYTMAAIPDPKLGPRHVDVETMYNTERYRPNYYEQAGLADLPHKVVSVIVFYAGFAAPPTSRSPTSGAASMRPRRMRSTFLPRSIRGSITFNSSSGTLEICRAGVCSTLAPERAVLRVCFSTTTRRHNSARSILQKLCCIALRPASNAAAGQ